MHSDVDGEDWGYRFTVVAPVCEDSAVELEARFEVPRLVAELALAASDNSTEGAGQLLQADLAGLHRRADEWHNGSRDAFLQGRFTDPGNRLEVRGLLLETQPRRKGQG